MHQADQPALEAEPDDYEYDSGIGGESIASSTTSISSSILKYREENGRTYHAYKVRPERLNPVSITFHLPVSFDNSWAHVPGFGSDGAYNFPNDAPENDRLDFQHHEFLLTFSGRLFTAPIPSSHPLSNVLDVGTGTGIWAIDFADEHPESKVIGVDLSPIQPSFLPPNVTFQIDDLEEQWTFRERFDFVYSRMMIGSFADVPKFIGQAYGALGEGGWLEMCDVVYPVRINDGKFPEDCAVVKWCALFEEACSKVGRNAQCARLYEKQMIAAGFEDVVSTTYIWPSNRWPKDKKLKELGMWQLENFSSGIEAISVALFTRVLGWSTDELDVLLAQVRSELKNTKIHSYFDVIVVYGRKPH